MYAKTLTLTEKTLKIDTMTEFDFEPKRILKHKTHITINEGQEYQEQVQHLEKKDDEFVELAKTEVSKKYGSKKLTRQLDYNSRDGLEIKDKGFGKTPEWFDYIIPTIDWDKTTFLYELDHLWMNMFFVRELYGEEGKGREQIVQLTRAENGLELEVLCQLDYDTDLDMSKENEPNGFIKVEIVDTEPAENVEGLDIQTDFKHSYFEDDQEHLAEGLKEILTGICLKHGYDGEQIKFEVSETEDEVMADILDKDFVVRFSKQDYLDEDIGAWVRELLIQDGCPLQMEADN